MSVTHPQLLFEDFDGVAAIAGLVQNADCQLVLVLGTCTPRYGNMSAPRYGNTRAHEHTTEREQHECRDSVDCKQHVLSAVSMRMATGKESLPFSGS